MNIYLKKIGINSTIISILLIIVALLLIFNPIKSVNFIIAFLGIILLINGCSHIFSYIFIPNEIRLTSFELVEGIIYVLIGSIFILNPEIIQSLLPTVIGIWLILESITHFKFVYEIKNNYPELKSNKISFFSILGIILGIIIILHPLVSVAFITSFCGIVILVNEICNIIQNVYIIKKIIQ